MLKEKTKIKNVVEQRNELRDAVQDVILYLLEVKKNFHPKFKKFAQHIADEEWREVRASYGSTVTSLVTSRNRSQDDFALWALVAAIETMIAANQLATTYYADPKTARKLCRFARTHLRKATLSLTRLATYTQKEAARLDKKATALDEVHSFTTT